MKGSTLALFRNKWGALQHSIVVEGLKKVNPLPPKFIEKLENQTVFVGMDTHLKCVVDSGGLVPSIYWAKVEEQGNKTIPNFTMIPEYRNKEELVLRNVAKKDQGHYACVVRTDGGNVITRAYVHVLEQHEAIQQGPANTTASAGTNVNFHCRTPLALIRYIHWVRLLETDIKVLSKENQVLTIEYVSKADEGLYACAIGTTTENTFWGTAYLRVA